MPFYLTTFGQEPKAGWSLWISMHGGGGAPKQVNDQQWENQKHLYKLDEGIYVAPRAPTDNWNLWHEAHIDPLFDRLIEDLIVLKHVDPNRVYIMGYSAGGDGVYQFAPRMADRWAAAAMMAGHPNDASWLGPAQYRIRHPGRRIGFGLQPQQGRARMDRPARSTSSRRSARLCPFRQDFCRTKGIGWTARMRRCCRGWPRSNEIRCPTKSCGSKAPWFTIGSIGWRFPTAIHRKPGRRLSPSGQGQTVEIKSAEKVGAISIRFDDRMADLDKPIRVVYHGKPLFDGPAHRTIATLFAHARQTRRSGFDVRRGSSRQTSSRGREAGEANGGSSRLARRRTGHVHPFRPGDVARCRRRQSFDAARIRSIPTNSTPSNGCRRPRRWAPDYIVFVAKHSGGFCWWQTDTTDYSVKNTPWHGGKGDVLAELSASCKKHGMKLGVYLSPTDHKHQAVGGGRCPTPELQAAYNKIYRQQLRKC